MQSKDKRRRKMMKKFLTLFLTLSLLFSLFCISNPVFADDASETEDFESYQSDYTLTAEHGKTVTNEKWTVSDSGNAVGTAAKAAKDALTIETETDPDTQTANRFGRISRNWPDDASDSDKLSNMYFKRALNCACTGTVSVSMQLRLCGLQKNGINIYLYDSAGNMILRCLATGGKLSFYKYTQSNPDSSVNIGYIETCPLQNTWANLTVTVNTFSGEIRIAAGEGFQTQSTRTITDKDTAVAISDVSCIGYSIERFFANGSGYLDLDNITVMAKPFSVADDFTFRQISDEEQGGVTQNLRLPQSYTATDKTAYDIAWSSSDESVLSGTGTVVRSRFDKIVRLTASFSQNNVFVGSKTFYINILAEGAYHFYEYFSTSPGAAVTAYNSWEMDNAAQSGQSAKVEESPTESQNIVLAIHRTKKAAVQRVKRFFNRDTSALNQSVWLSASVYRKNDAQPFYITVRNASTEKNILAQIQIAPDGAASYWALDTNGSAKRYTLISNKENYVPYGTWCNLSVCMNYADNTFLLYVNGQPSDAAGNFYSKNKNGLTTAGTGGIEFDIERNTNPADAVIDDRLYIDNINVRTQADAFAVEDVSVYDRNGVAVKDLQNGGSVEGITLSIQKTITESCKLLAALYDDREVLVSAYTKTLNPTEMNASSYTMRFHMALPQDGDLSAYSLKFYAWDSQTLSPVMPAYTYQPSDKPIVIYVAGDSIGANYSEGYYPQCGYGQVLGKFFDSERVVIDNRAVGGRTTLSFIEEGRLGSILSSITNGDYLLIQFGHNDQTKQNEVGIGTKIDETATAGSTEYAEGTYQYYLMQYIEKARAAGANPILVTPPYRRSFDNSGNLLNAVLTPYVEAMRTLSVAQNVPLIDLNAGWTKHFKDNGITNAALAKDYYMVIDKDDPRFADDPQFQKSNYCKIGTGEWSLPHTDGTHLNIWSAEIAAQIMVHDLTTLTGASPLWQYVNDYTPVCPWK